MSSPLNVLWDCIALVDDAARHRITELGGIDTICMSSPALLRRQHRRR